MFTTPDRVFDTFPWPQSPTAKRARVVADGLGFLLALNLTCAAREKVGEPVVPPGLPPFVAPTPEARASFVTDDRLKASVLQ